MRATERKRGGSPGAEIFWPRRGAAPRPDSWFGFPGSPVAPTFFTELQGYKPEPTQRSGRVLRAARIEIKTVGQHYRISKTCKYVENSLS